MNDPRALEIVELEGLIPYERGYRLQIERRNAVEAGTAGNALFLLEHAPVFTLGRNARREHILASDDHLKSRGIAVHVADRGGDVTYHGPGQLVAYPILDLRHWKCSISWYLRSLEEVIIRVLDDLGLHGERLDGYTGVWVDGNKVAAIGVGVHNWVTFHGIALNVEPDMEHFQMIVPCGIPDKPVTFLNALLNAKTNVNVVNNLLKKHMIKHFRDT